MDYKSLNNSVRYSGDDPIISTTGKASRELFEISESSGKDHKYDFLIVDNNEAHETVGGMTTVEFGLELVKVALSCGYSSAITVFYFHMLR